jgi:hypothetical protein
MNFRYLWLCFTAAASYKELLQVEQFEDGKVLTTFTFKRTVENSKHYNILPKAIGEVFSSFGVKELHLTFTHGQWRVDRYGYSKNHSPQGANLWTWLETKK